MVDRKLDTLLRTIESSWSVMFVEQTNADERSTELQVIYTKESAILSYVSRYLDERNV